ncbi:MAG TPA: type III-A CRISPR-associated RAMP protein Csm3 [Candidatus Atribacteria bacterium]|nr:type III-A CRISPR-associated RAMP protein Csm3 [Candidatus Atribacteria bacterium]
MKLLKYRKISGKIHCETGLHIGVSRDNIQIGGIDNPVIRNSLDNLPYIPGSSLKGKLRSLVEWKYTDIKSKNGNIHNCSDANCPICRIFGTTDENAAFGPTRLIVRDAFIVEKDKKEKSLILESMEKNYFEIKEEVSIDRLRGTAAKAGPRTMERVPAGVEFDFEMVYRIFEFEEGDQLNQVEKDNKMFNYVIEAMSLLEKDVLGGSGSRGYGKVKFKDIRIEDFQDGEQKLITEGENLKIIQEKIKTYEDF